jgi:hypothetical protein
LIFLSNGIFQEFLYSLVLCTLSALLSFFVSVVLYFAFYLQHTKQILMLPAGFEQGAPAGDRPQTFTLESSATGIGIKNPKDSNGNKTLDLAGCSMVSQATAPGIELGT